MLAPIATLAFLVALWACAFVAVRTVQDSRSKIRAALRGEVDTPRAAVPVRTVRRVEYSRSAPMRARPQLRAAA